MWRELVWALGDARLVAAKDLRIEWRARTALAQMIPFVVLVLVLFGFALDANRAALQRAAPGLFWMTVLFATVIAVQRSVALETTDSARRMLLLSGMSPAAAFMGKAAAVAVQLMIVELVLMAGVVVLFGTSLEAPLIAIATSVVATVGLASAGSLLGAVVAETRSLQTVLPILLLPVVAPVLIGASRAFDAALGTVAANGWVWVAVLTGFAAVNLALGTATYHILLEDS